MPKLTVKGADELAESVDSMAAAIPAAAKMAEKAANDYLSSLRQRVNPLLGKQPVGRQVISIVKVGGVQSLPGVQGVMAKGMDNTGLASVTTQPMAGVLAPHLPFGPTTQISTVFAPAVPLAPEVNPLAQTQQEPIEDPVTRQDVERATQIFSDVFFAELGKAVR